MNPERDIEVIEGNYPRITGDIYDPKGVTIDNEILESWKIVPPSRARKASKDGVEPKPLTSSEIFSATGIERRTRGLPHETPEFMAINIARTLFHSTGRPDAVFVSNSHPSGVNISQRILEEFDLDGVFNTDIHAACSGFVEGLAYIGDNPDKFNGKKIAFISAENYEDSLESLENNDKISDESLSESLFATGGGGLAFIAGEGVKIKGSRYLQLPPEQSQSLKMAIDRSKMVEPYIEIEVPESESGFFEQDGGKVYEFVRNKIPSLIIQSIYGCDEQLTSKDIKLVIPHQPSKKVLDTLVTQTNKILAEGGEQELNFYYDIKDGNYSSASSLRALIKAMDTGIVTKGDKIAIVQFGAGLYARSVVVEIG